MNLKHTLFAFLVLLPSFMMAGEPVCPKAPVLTTGPSADKWQYHLFHPTPTELMREMSTDRPDATESPYTVDAGHFQIEASFFDYSCDHSEGAKSEVRTYGSLNLKAGLLSNVDLQVVFDSYSNESVKEVGHRSSVSGFSDVQARLKINLWGNDGGRTALGLMPFVKIPSGTALSNDRWAGGVIVPFAFELADGIGAGLMAEADFVYDEDSGSYETEWVHTATVGFDIVGSLGAFVEYMGVAGSAPGFRYQASFNTGVTYGVTDNVQLDVGVRLGLYDAAEDFGVFAGISVRF